MTKREELDEHRRELDKSYNDCIGNRVSVLDVIIDLKYAYDALAGYVLERDEPREVIQGEQPSVDELRALAYARGFMTLTLEARGRILGAGATAAAQAQD